MKHLKLFLMMLVIANTALITSCSKDDESDDTPVNENPIINLAGDNNNVASDITLVPGESFQVTVTASENPTTTKNLRAFRVVREFTGTQANTVLDSTGFNEKTFTLVMTFTAATIEGTEKISFTIEDKDGKTGTASFVVTTESPVTTTPLASEELDGKYYHIQGSLQGAYDLVAGALKSSGDADADKDLKNTDAAAAAFTGSSTAGNTTMFVKDNSLDYANTTTHEALIAAYGGGTASGTITDPAAGDLYVAKLRGGDDYVLIEVLTVDPADNTCSCGNTGIITFKYKGK